MLFRHLHREKGSSSSSSKLLLLRCGDRKTAEDFGIVKEEEEEDGEEEDVQERDQDLPALIFFSRGVPRRYKGQSLLDTKYGKTKKMPHRNYEKNVFSDQGRLDLAAAVGQGSIGVLILG